MEAVDSFLLQLCRRRRTSRRAGGDRTSSKPRAGRCRRAVGATLLQNHLPAAYQVRRLVFDVGFVAQFSVLFQENYLSFGDFEPILKQEKLSEQLAPIQFSHPERRANVVSVLWINGNRPNVRK